MSKLGVAFLLALFLQGCAGTSTNRSTGEYIDDSTIITKIKTNLILDPDVDGNDITVVIDLGDVQLLGFVDTHSQRLRAEIIAEEIEGVRSLENDLLVVRGPRRVGQYVDDKILVGRVNSAFAGSQYLLSNRINVLVNRDVVLLGGFVNSDHEKELAARLARNVNDVLNVYNEIRVRSR